MNTITLPVGFGFAAVAAPATSVILGPAWSGAVPFVAAFAIASTLQVMQSPFSTLLLMRGHTKTQSHAVWLEFVFFLMFAAMLVPTFYLIGLVWARMVGSLINLLFCVLATHRYCKMPMKQVGTAIARPLFGAILMYLLVETVVSHLQSVPLQLGLGIVCGALSFALWSFLTWVWSGKPAGLESTAIDFVTNLKMRNNGTGT